MNATEKAVGGTGGRQRRQFTTEQKLAILQQWHEGTPVTHICRQHALNPKVFYRSEEAVGLRLERPAKPRRCPKPRWCSSNSASRSWRALGRKALEVDILKKAFEIKGLRLPEGVSNG